MSLDMNDAEPQRSSELIPDGTFAKVAMTIRPGGIDGQNETDRGLLKASSLSDALLLDCEFTVTEGPHARRKFWQMFTVAGGKVDEQGVSIGWKISKSTFRAMIDSALGLDPNDMSEATKQKRILRGLADLNGIVFVAKIRIEPSDDPRYGDANKLDRVVLPNEKEWKAVMEGREVAPSPSRRAAPAPAAQPAQPAWNRAPTAQPPARAVTPAWAGAAMPAQPQPPQAAKPAGPAWLNG
jgi:hypothetical protein